MLLRLLSSTASHLPQSSLILNPVVQLARSSVEVLLGAPLRFPSAEALPFHQVVPHFPPLPRAPSVSVVQNATDLVLTDSFHELCLGLCGSLGRPPAVSSVREQLVRCEDRV